MRLALCQMNATVGDIARNAERIREGTRAAREAGAELVLFPELALTGYPPEDLLLKEHFLAAAGATMRELAADTRGIVAVVGYPERAEDVFNAAAVLADGEVRAVYRKVYLPNYGVFDEQRYFQAGPGGAVLDLGRARLGLTVCEDIWEPGPPASEEALAGATLILNISASPYHAGKGAEREHMFAQRARENLACVAFCGLVGGQDELVFDGHSCVIDHTGATIARAAQFKEELLVCDVDLDAAAAARLRDPSQRPAARRSEHRARLLPALPAPPATAESAPTKAGGPLAEPLEPVEAEVYGALTLGLHDYVRKNGFERVVLGLSGGIDSALVACLAVDALGSERVNAAIMPSPYSSTATQSDARALAAALGVHTHELAIEPAMDAYTRTLITNQTLLFIDQASTFSRPVEAANLPAGFENARVWRATITTPGARGYQEYFAFFNLDSKPVTLRVSWKELGLDNNKHTAEDAWTGETGKPSKDVTVTLPAHGSTVVEAQ